MASLPLGRISCVICAYNEGARIGLVLSAIVGNPLFGEIIVVNDGSTDDTEANVLSFSGVALISYKDNRGKSYALGRGINATSCDYVMLLDADLFGLRSSHIDALATPVLLGAADVSMSLRGNSLGVYRMIGIDFVSGERVLSRSLLLEAAETIMQLPRWAGEVFMNQLIIDRGLRVAVVDWRDVTHMPKHRKAGRWRGAVDDLEMVGETLKALTPAGVVRQNFELWKLKRYPAARGRQAGGFTNSRLE